MSLLCSRNSRAKASASSDWGGGALAAAGRLAPAGVARSPESSTGGGSPGQRVGLGVAEALHRLQHAFLVAQAGVLDGAARRHLQAITRDLAYIDAADMQLLHKSCDQVDAIGA